LVASCSFLLVGVVPRFDASRYPPLRRGQRGGLALVGDLGKQPMLFESLVGGVRVVSTVQVDAHLLGQPSQGLSHGVQSLESRAAGRDG
jgi:hypothetical protein